MMASDCFASEAVGMAPFRAAAVEKAFTASQAAGILALAGEKSAPDWPLSWMFWRDFGTRYLTQLCQTQPTSERLEPLPPPDASTLVHLTLCIPPTPGAEYCSPDVLAAIWSDLDTWALNAIARSAEGLAGFLHLHAPLWRQVGRVCFHLAENKKDPEFPFAFMATYVPRLGKNARAQHLPLNQALSEYAGANNREALLRLLEPVHDASTRCEWVRELLESNDIYHPLAWTPEEAYPFLKDVPLLEESGLVVRLPDWWKKRPRPRVQVSIGSNVGESLTAKALLDFRVQLTIDGADLTPEEIATLTAAGEGLAFLRGQWVEVDGEKLREALEQRVAFRLWKGCAFWQELSGTCPATTPCWKRADGPLWRLATGCVRCWPDYGSRAGWLQCSPVPVYKLFCAPTSRPASTGSGSCRNLGWGLVWLMTWVLARPSRLFRFCWRSGVVAEKYPQACWYCRPRYSPTG